MQAGIAIEVIANGKDSFNPKQVSEVGIAENGAPFQSKVVWKYPKCVTKEITLLWRCVPLSSMYMNTDIPAN